MSDRRRRLPVVPSWLGQRDVGLRRTLPLVLVALITILSLSGGILDRHWLGLGGQYGGSGRPASLTIVEQAARYGNWFTQYALLARHAPGSTILLDADTSTGMFTSDLFALAEVGAVRQVAVDVVRPSREPFASVGRGERTWTLWLDEPGRPTTLAVRAESRADGTTETLIVEVQDPDPPLLDPRSSLPARIAAVTSVTGLPEPLLEGALYVILTLIGGLLVPRGPPLPRGVRPALALIAGLALVGLLGMLRIPGVVPLGVALAIAVLGSRSVGRARCGWCRADVIPLAAFLSLLVAVVAVTHASGSVVVSLDSFSYLGRAHELAAGRLGPGQLSLKRGAFLQGLYGLGFGAGVDILAAPGLVLLIAATILLVGLGWSYARHPSTRVVVVGLALLPWVHLHTVSLARYVNSHAMLAVMLLALALVVHWAWRAGTTAQRAFLPLVGLLASAPVVMRPEGVLLVGLLLLGASRVREGVFPTAWRAAGATAALWGLVLFVESLRVETEPSRLLVAFGLTGIVMVLVPTLRARLGRVWTVVPVLAVAVLWSIALMLTVGPKARARGFVEAAIINLGEGRGRWGLLAPVLILLAILALAIRPAPTDGPGVAAMRVLLLGFIPVNLLAKLGDGIFGSNGSILDLLLVARGGGRVGWGDSVNRMWMHAVLVVVGFAVVRLVGLLDDRKGDGAGTAGGTFSRARSGARLVTFPLLAVWVASLWAPFYVEADRVPAFEQSETWQVEILGDRPGPVLVDGTVIQQVLGVPPEAVPEGESTHASLCAVIPFVTYNRENRGWVEVDLTVGARSETYIVQQPELEDWTSEAFCLDDIHREELKDGLLRVTLRGGGVQEEGAAVSALVGGRGGLTGQIASQALALRVEVVESTSNPQERPLGPQFLTVTAPNLLPAVLALIVVMILMVRPQGGAGVEAPETTPRGRGAGAVLGPAGAPFRVGVSLVLVGVVTLAVGLRPHLADRDLIPIDPPPLGRAPASGLVLRHGGSVEQTLDAGLLPESDDVGRDSLFQRERVCIEIPVELSQSEAEASLAERGLVVSLSSGAREGAPSGRWFRDTKPISPVTPESDSVRSCFDVTPELLRETEDLRLSVRAATLPSGEVLELGSRVLRASEGAAKTLDGDEMTVALRMLDVRFLRERPSVREWALATVGWGALMSGGVVVSAVGLVTRGRRRKFHGSDCG